MKEFFKNNLIPTSKGIIGLLLALGFFLITPLSAGPQNLGGLTLTEVAPRIITPNGDGYNDVVFLRFDTTIAGIPIDSSVYDLNGASVSSLKFDLGDTALSWDGKDNAGRVVPAGIYIYVVKLGKNTVSGTIVVAK